MREVGGGGQRWSKFAGWYLRTDALWCVLWRRVSGLCVVLGGVACVKGEVRVGGGEDTRKSFENGSGGRGAADGEGGRGNGPPCRRL